MQLQDLLTLYEYNDWATGRILTACGQISTEQFLAPANHSHGSLRGTLVHTLDAEYGWRMFCQHNRQTPEMVESDFPTVDALTERWQDEKRARHDFLTSLEDEDLTRLVRSTSDSGQPRARVLWHCLVHVVNHGTHHRSEAAAILTNCERSPGDLDFMLFLSRQ